MAQSAAIATAFIIQQSKNITPEEGFGTAIYHYIEGTKTFPPALGGGTETVAPKVDPVEETPKDQGKKKPWWKRK